MSERGGDGFADSDASDLAAFVARRAADIDLPIPNVCLPGVLENLRALQDHARIVEAWLKASPPTAEEAPLP